MYFNPTDLVRVQYKDKTKVYRLDELSDYYRAKKGLIGTEVKYDATIKWDAKKESYTISLNDTGDSILLEKKGDIYLISFNPNKKNYLQRTTKWEADDVDKQRLINAALQCLPDGSKVKLNNSSERPSSEVGGLSIHDLNNYQLLANADGVTLVADNVE
jgi:hypothetical protein